MASVLIPDVPEELHKRLAQAAAQSGRSLGQQALEILDRALRQVSPVALPTPIIPLRSITQEELTAAIGEGRE